ncbi:hypothetical protein ACLKA6_002001 [Drosophila palustris]
MENDDYQPLLRRRRNSYLKWTESQVLEFLELVLDLVKDVPESLEKPTAQKFYTKVMESTAMISHVQYVGGYRLRYSIQKFWLGRSRASVARYSTVLDGDQITIGDVVSRLKKPENLHLVPQKYVNYAPDGTVQLNQSALHHLRWMLQKDLLKQDMFLLGSPGPLRRQLVMQYLELTQRELEYVALSRDTTESDLKQRREIQHKNSMYYDQCAVRAALHGRLLVLDGVEHCEQNVLPVLNNLLENREMHLESGKFLMAPDRYDKLLETHTKEQLEELGILRVSEHFRVVALGLPVQKYKGTPLDPPLRSRFQSRHVSFYTFSELYDELHQLTPNVPGNQLKQLLTFGLTLQKADEDIKLPDFPIHNLRRVAQMLQTNPSLSLHDVISTVYPFQSILNADQQKRIQELFTSLQIQPMSTQGVQEITANVEVDRRQYQMEALWI